MPSVFKFTVAVSALLLAFVVSPRAQPARLDTSAPVPYFIESGRGVPGYLDSDRELAALALDAWSRESGGVVKFTEAGTPASALIRVRWIAPGDGVYGETERVSVNGKPGAIVNVMPDVEQQGEPLGESRQGPTACCARPSCISPACTSSATPWASSTRASSRTSCTTSGMAATSSDSSDDTGAHFARATTSASPPVFLQRIGEPFSRCIRTDMKHYLAAPIAIVATTLGVLAQQPVTRTGTLAERGLTPARFPQHTKLAENVYVWTDVHPSGVHTTNDLIVVTADGVLVADGQKDTATTAKLVEFIKDITTQPIRYVVVASEHGDHTGGNEAFPPGVVFIASPASQFNLMEQAKGDKPGGAKSDRADRDGRRPTNREAREHRDSNHEQRPRPYGRRPRGVLFRLRRISSPARPSRFTFFRIYSRGAVRANLVPGR